MVTPAVFEGAASTPADVPGITSLAVARNLGLVAGTTAYLRWFMKPSSAAATYPETGYLAVLTDGYENDTTGGFSNKTGGGAVTAANSRANYTPPIFFGIEPLIPEDAYKVLALCDSHGSGIGDTFYNLSQCGFVERALVGKAGIINYPRGGQRAVDFSFPSATGYRLGAARLVDACLSNLGINDLANGQTYVQLIGTSGAPGTLPTFVWSKVAAAGAKVVQTTPTPMTGSGDGWLTLEGQTIPSAPAEAQWILCLAAYRDGTVLKNFPYVSKIIDTAATVESATTPGRWAPPVTYKSSTTVTASSATTVTIAPAEASKLAVGDAIFMPGSANVADRIRVISAINTGTGVLTVDGGAINFVSNPTAGMVLYGFTPAYSGTVTTGTNNQDFTDSAQNGKLVTDMVGKRVHFYAVGAGDAGNLGVGGIVVNAINTGRMILRMMSNGTYVNRVKTFSATPAVASRPRKSCTDRCRFRQPSGQPWGYSVFRSEVRRQRMSARGNLA